MSSIPLERIGRDLDKIAGELWNIDGPDGALYEVAGKLSTMKCQVAIQKSLQATANLLRQHPLHKALPRQQATKVKYFVRFIFGRDSRGGGRYKRLRALNCNALILFGLSFTIEELVKMDDAAIDILQERGLEFIRHRELSRHLHRDDINKAVNAKLEDPDDDGLYEKFIQGIQDCLECIPRLTEPDHTAIRLQLRKRKHDDLDSGGGATHNHLASGGKAGPNQGALDVVDPGKESSADFS